MNSIISSLIVAAAIVASPQAPPSPHHGDCHGGPAVHCQAGHKACKKAHKPEPRKHDGGKPPREHEKDHGKGHRR